MAQRQIRWNVKSESNPERHEYHFLIVNDQRGSSQIMQRLREQLAPVDEEMILTEGTFQRLPWRLISLSSPMQSRRIDWKKTYGGKVTKDHTLYTRKRGTVAEYVESHIEQLAS